MAAPLWLIDTSQPGALLLAALYSCLFGWWKDLPVVNLLLFLWELGHEKASQTSTCLQMRLRAAIPTIWIAPEGDLKDPRQHHLLQGDQCIDLVIRQAHLSGPIYLVPEASMLRSLQVRIRLYLHCLTEQCLWGRDARAEQEI